MRAATDAGVLRVPVLLATVLLQTAATHQHTTSPLGRISSAPPSFAATTQLLGHSGELHGTAALTGTDTSTRVIAQLDGLLPGPYAIDLREAGRCDGEGFAGTSGSIARSANVIVGVNGSATIELTVEGRRFTGGPQPVLGPAGAAVILESAPREGQIAIAIACGALAPR